VNLQVLGEVLRQRREALDLTREELSRRVGMTPMYIYMVEGARPRRTGKPSQPKRETLKLWAEALGMREEETNHILELGGYHPLDPVVEDTLELTRAIPPRQSRPRTDDEDVVYSLALDVPAPPRPGNRAERQALRARLDGVLERAASQPERWPEIVAALTSLLDDLERRLESDG
jgi:transcriptional regulator with XRE-family HTH domain